MMDGGKETMSGSKIAAEITKQVKVILEEFGVELNKGLQVMMSHPTLVEHGDYSTNIAMLLAKELRKSPLQIANLIKEKLEVEGNVGGLCSQIAVAAPGFINFYIDWQVWANLSSQPHKTASHSKVLIEHTSINPNKSAHIGHLRNSCVGDSLARMLQAAGHEVEVHNYIDDLGNQLADTVVGILHTHTDEPFARFGDFCWETYAKINRVYKEEPAMQEERAKVLLALEEGHSNIAWLGTLAAEKIVHEHIEEMEQFGIDYDVLVWESNIVREGFWEATAKLLMQTDMFYEVKEGKLAGCWVLKHQDDKSEAAGDSNFQANKVLIRSNGILTYTAKDIAYHLWKFGLLTKDFTYKKFTKGIWTTHKGGVKRSIGHANQVINVIDYRQEYPQIMVKQALEALGYKDQAEQLKHVSYGVVALSPDTAAGLGVDISDGKSSYAMSGRQGIGVKVSELLDHMEQVIESKRSRKRGLSSRTIAAAAIRYYLLKFNLQTDVVFDLQQATEVTGNTGIYVLYSYARANSILNKAGKETQLPVSFPFPEGSVQLVAQEYQLLRQIAYWEETFESAVDQLAPNIICGYVFELASLFNHFYGICPIMKGPAHKQPLRLWLTAKFKETCHQALQAIGLPTPKSM
jgi:arginyl-tRNA synthetase